MRSHLLRYVVGTLVAVLLSAQAGAAAAQDTGKDIRGDVAGTIGLGLLGAEVGLMLPPAFNLQDAWWAWALFPTVGATGGVVAGIFAFDPGEPSPAVTLSIFGAGAALAVPAVVAAMAFKSKRDNAEKMVAGSLLHFDRRGARLGVPMIESRPMLTAEERLRLGARQRNAMRISLVSAQF